MNKNKFLLAVIGFACITSGNVALAHQQGDFILRVGSATVEPIADLDTINVANITTIQGTEVNANSQLGLKMTYMIRPDLGVEVLFVTPFTHEITGTDTYVTASASGLKQLRPTQVIGSTRTNGSRVNETSANETSANITRTDITVAEVKQLLPIISIQYYLANPSSRFQPYIGIGLNYTAFFDESVSPQLNNALERSAGLADGSVDADLDLDNSMGRSAQLGFDFQISNDWMICGSMYRIDIDTKATIKTAIANASIDIKTDPTVYMFGVSYRL